MRICDKYAIVVKRSIVPVTEDEREAEAKFRADFCRNLLNLLDGYVEYQFDIDDKYADRTMEGSV